MMVKFTEIVNPRPTNQANDTQQQFKRRFVRNCRELSQFH